MMDALTLVRSEGGAAMTDEAYRHERQGLRARLSDWTGGARDMTRAALKEAMNWDAYKWTVLALLTATFLLVALSYGGIRAELAALKQPGGTTDGAVRNADIDKQMADMKDALTQARSEAETSIGEFERLGLSRLAPSVPELIVEHAFHPLIGGDGVDLTREVPIFQ